MTNRVSISMLGSEISHVPSHVKEHNQLVPASFLPRILIKLIIVKLMLLVSRCPVLIRQKPSNDKICQSHEMSPLQSPSKTSAAQFHRDKPSEYA
jgi:hypothetical protein